MNNRPRNWIFFLVLIAVILTITDSCNKEETIKDPIVTWQNPGDISFGTLLSSIQLNATSDVSGTFAYTPTFGTKLNEGEGQILTVDFTPSDSKTYRSATKTVKINVTASNISTDYDGNVYHTVIIGTQVWTVENLRTTKFNDGSPIPFVTGDGHWVSANPAFCWYNNDVVTNKYKYGALYNWYTVNTGKLAPAGWHIPTDDEWTMLVNHLGGKSAAGGKMKTTGTIEAVTGLWHSPNTDASNESGFTAVPAGVRGAFAEFMLLGRETIWWSSDSVNPLSVWSVHYDYGSISNGFCYDGSVGYSVRCVRDY